MSDYQLLKMALNALECLINYDNHGEPYDEKDVDGKKAAEAIRARLSATSKD